MVNLREAIQDKLEELEDYYQALQSLERVQTGKSPVWTQKEIEVTSKKCLSNQLIMSSAVIGFPFLIRKVANHY